jgi:hypothetical protein
MQARVKAAQMAVFYPDHDRHDEAYAGAQNVRKTDAENDHEFGVENERDFGAQI